MLSRIFLVLYFRFIIEILLFYSLIIAISLILANHFLQANLAAMQEKTSSLEPVYAKINQEIKTVNQQLKNIDLGQSSSLVWSPYLSQIIKSVPPTVSLNNFNLYQDNEVLMLQGLAKTREDLLFFKDQLQQLPWIKKIEIPVSLLTMKENVNFTLTAKYVSKP